MEEGSARVSIISVKVTPGGKHAEAGSKRFTLPVFISPAGNQVPPTTSYPSGRTSVPVVEILAKPHDYNPHIHPELVMGEKVDAEGDMPIGDISAPVSLPPEAPVLRASNAPAFGDFPSLAPTMDEAPESLPPGAPAIKTTNTLKFGDVKHSEHSAAPSNNKDKGKGIA